MEPGSAKRRLSAILMADVVDYSRLMGRDEEGTVAALRSRREVFTSRIADFHGRVVDAKGDAIMAEFATPTDAVGCAVEIQREIAGRNADLPAERRMEFRIGINLGEVLVEGDEIYGDGVNIAARLESLADPGGICISRATRDQVGSKLPLSYDYLGEKSVKNIAQPVRTYKVLLGQEEEPAAGPAEEAEDPILAMPTGPAIAVLPFTNLSSDPEQEFFSDGMTEEIITDLTRYKELHVIARNSTFQYKGRAVDVRAVGKELGAKYVLQGSVRRSQNRIRVTAQLLDAADGSHLWAETYDSDLTAGDIFDLQDEITEKVVGALGGKFGELSRVGWEEARGRGTDNLGAYECVLRAYSWMRSVTRDEHARVRDCLEKTVQQYPDYADAWSELAFVTVREYGFGYNLRPDPLERALRAAQCAVELAPASQRAHLVLADVLYFRHDETFFDKAERVIAMNPNNSEVLIVAGAHIGFAGRWARGVALVGKAISLTPNPPGQFYSYLGHDQYLKGDYAEALKYYSQIETPGYFWNWAHLAKCYGQLGRAAEAQDALAHLEELYPEFGENAWLEFRKWYWIEDDIAKSMEGLRKAGLEIPLDEVER